MCVSEIGRLLRVFPLLLVLGSAIYGCATSAQLKALEEKTQRALDRSQEALTASEDAKRSWKIRPGTVQRPQRVRREQRVPRQEQRMLP
jgi:hypothetical protein